MSKSVVIMLPVADLTVSTRFYEALGCRKDERFSGAASVSLDWSDSVALRLLRRDAFAAFAPRPVADAHTVMQTMTGLALDSREAVDAVVETAATAGGRADPIQSHELDYMYGRSFEDPDGHVFWPVWMKPDAQLPD